MKNKHKLIAIISTLTITLIIFLVGIEVGKRQVENAIGNSYESLLNEDSEEIFTVMGEKKDN